jgi:23S rRNA-/tRNA-specific pseudouridylate synthase
MQDTKTKIRGKATDDSVVDSPCWGSPTCCALSDLLQVIDRSVILHETNDYLVLNKPPDLRMDGGYPATVHKLLTYWYPPKSIENDPDLIQSISKISKSNDLKDAELRPCHQLDYATSGALLVGRNRKAAGRACEAFRDRTTKKVYLALVHSHVKVECKTLSLSQQDLYRQIRIFDQQLADRRKAHRKTFKGFQPPSSIFMKWKSFAGKGGKRPRDSEMMQRVEEAIPQQERSLMVHMSWGEVKTNDSWRIVFEEASTIYNELLQNEDRFVVEDNKKLLELPSVFRLEEDGDPNTFYINASLAQHPTDFAMVIHPGSQDNLGTPDPLLDFKLAITRCSVLKHTKHKTSKVTKMKLEPLTGRRHRLRCHMVVVNAPILGDVTYEGDFQHDLVERMCLHAFQLKIAGVIDAEAPDPFVLNDDSNAVDVKIV